VERNKEKQLFIRWLHGFRGAMFIFIVLRCKALRSIPILIRFTYLLGIVASDLGGSAVRSSTSRESFQSMI
jgi:hypothetical protein